MLQKLYIKNLAIIEELLIDFESGLNIITGETGSGKSLIIQSIQLLLGKKITKELLRTGADELIIDGMFYYNKEEINIRRIYNSNGKSISYIDEHPVKVSELLNVTKKMVDIQSQHEHQMLLDPKNHIHYLDAFAMNLADVKEIKNSFYKMKKYQADLDLMKEEQKHIKEKEDLYRFQIQELKLYPISDAYEKEINNKYKLLSNATEIQDSLNSCDKLLNNENDGIVLKLLKIARRLEKISKNDNKIDEIYSRISSNIIDLEDISNVIHEIGRGLDVASNELDEVGKIVEHMETLKRKYGGSMKSVEMYLDKISSAIGSFKVNKKEIELLELKLYKIESYLNEKALILSKERKSKSIDLELSISKHLKSLSMDNIKFQVNISSKMEDLHDLGIDKCEFFVSTNQGEKLRPLSKIISGGEASRIMLALKMAIQSNDSISTLIFDEIDSGISGIVAEEVGNKIEELSSKYQIICVSHLSQIAGKGNNHYKVWKESENNRNSVRVDRLSDSKRIKEIASLISGKEITNAGIKQAEILLEDG